MTGVRAELRQHPDFHLYQLERENPLYFFNQVRENWEAQLGPRDVRTLDERVPNLIK